MFVSDEQLVELTHRRRPSAQARFLAARGMKFIIRDDGTIALHQDELEAHMVSAKARARRRWQPDLSAMDKAG